MKKLLLPAKNAIESRSSFNWLNKDIRSRVSFILEICLHIEEWNQMIMYATRTISGKVMGRSPLRLKALEGNDNVCALEMKAISFLSTQPFLSLTHKGRGELPRLASAEAASRTNSRCFRDNPFVSMVGLILSFSVLCRVDESADSLLANWLTGMWLASFIVFVAMFVYILCMRQCEKCVCVSDLWLCCRKECPNKVLQYLSR